MTYDPGRSRPDSIGSPDAAPGLTPGPTPGLQELEARLLLSASPLDDPTPVEPVSAEQAEVVAAGGATQTFGIDVSVHQGSINWNTVAGTNIEYVWAKATEGVNFIDSRWVQNVTGAHNAGLYIGGYHFARPDTGGAGDAEAEASDFYDSVAPYLGDGYLRPALDLERGEGLSTTALTNWVHDFMNEFITLSSGIVPIIYMNGNYINQVNSTVQAYDLWYANPTNNPSNPPTAPGGYSYDLWQYSWTTSVSGIAGNVDGNVFFGDLGEFAAKYAISTTPDDHGDDRFSATPVAMPSTTAGVIGNGSDSDWFEMTLTAGEDYTFSLLNDGLSSGELRLYSSSGTLISTDTGPAVGSSLAELTFSAVVTDTYYLAVDSSGAGGYDLAVQETDDHGDTIGTASELSALVLGGIQAPGDVDYFHFSTVAGTEYDIQVQDFGIADAVLSLYTAGGAITAQDFGSSPGGTHAQLLWTAPITGDYYAAVSAQPGTVGDYIITMSETEPQLDGDLDGDGFVGINDLNVVLGNWNQNVPPADPAADPSGDGFVGIDDLNEVLGNWNAGTPPTGAEISAAIAAASQGVVANPDSAEQSEIVAAAGATQILGIDVSVWQGSINWNSVAASGKEFAFIRALDRDGLLDTRFLNNIVNSKNAGVIAGAYQFVTPWTDGYNDAVDEATLFANTIAPYLTSDYLRPVIDIEAGPPHSPTPIELDNTVLTNWVHDYMATFVSLTGIEPLIYTNTNHAQVAFDSDVNVYDLWLANWTNNPNNPPTGNADGVWNGFDLWQYSSTTSVPGISGNVDGNVYFGSLAELIADYGIVPPPDDHGDDRFNATAVAMPSVTGGNLETTLDTDWFQITLESGEDYTFTVFSGAMTGAELSLYSETGTLIDSSTGPAAGGVLAELMYTPAADGTFYLEVKSTGETGAYGLNVQEADDHGDTIGTASELGALALGGIQVSGDTDYFHFTATAGMQYDIKAQDFGIADAVLTLYDAGGAVVDTDSGSNPGGTHAQVLWAATANAEMYVAVTAQPATIGDYIISLTETSAQLTGDLDGDGFVGINDLNVVLGNWNQNVTQGDLLSGDPSDDGFVGIDDLNIVLGNWNAGTPPVASVSSGQAASSAPAEPDTDTVAPVRSELSQGLAIANWREPERSAFGEDETEGFVPAIGLWESDDSAA